MTTETNLTRVLQALNNILPPDFGPVTAGNVVFAWEKEVGFQAQPYQIASEALVEAEDFAGPFAASWVAGPDWWNASLMALTDGRFLITIAAGRGVGNRCPSLNVSYEQQASAEVIHAKIVKTNTLTAVN